MFTDKMNFRFGLLFIALFLLTIGFFFYKGWQQGEKIEAKQASSIYEDLRVLTGQLVQ